MKDTSPKYMRTDLPCAKVHLDVPCFHFGSMLQDILTDPRMPDDDYLFFGDDPTAPPPPDSEWHELRDANTGLAYRETYCLFAPRWSHGSFFQV